MTTHAKIQKWAETVPLARAGEVQLSSYYAAIDTLRNRQATWKQIYDLFKEQGITVQGTVSDFASVAIRGVRRYRARQASELKKRSKGK